MSSVTEEDPKRQRLIVCAIAFASFMVNIDTYIVNISLPTLAHYFHASTSDVSWVVLSYQLAVTSLLLIFGKLGDRMGLKKVFLAGFAMFTVSSGLCGLAPSLFILVLARFVQGIGASMLYALTPAMIPRFLPEKVRGPAFGALATATAAGITVGTPLGGIITGYCSWHWIFLINLPVGIAAILVCSSVLPREEPGALSKEQESFDHGGALLSFAGTLAIIYALSMGEKFGWTSPVITGCFILSAAALTAFIMREMRLPLPLFDMKLFRNRAFFFGNIASFLAYVYLAGNNFLMPFYLMRVKALPPEKAGFVFLIYSLVYMAVGPLSGWLSTKMDSRIICTMAMLLCSLSALGFSSIVCIPGFTFVIAYFVLLAISMAAFCTSNNNVVMGMAPEGKQGIVSGVFRMIMRLGIAFGVCIFQLFFSLGIMSTGQAVKGASGLPATVLVSGFHRAYVAGAVICLCAVLASALAETRTHNKVYHRR